MSINSVNVVYDGNKKMGNLMVFHVSKTSGNNTDDKVIIYYNSTRYWTGTFEKTVECDIHFVLPDYSERMKSYVLKICWEDKTISFTVDASEPKISVDDSLSIGSSHSIKCEYGMRGLHYKAYLEFGSNKESLKEFSYSDFIKEEFFDESEELLLDIIPGYSCKYASGTEIRRKHTLYSFDYEFSYELCKKFRDFKSMNASVVFESYWSDGTLYKKTSIPIKLVVPEDENTKPTIKKITITPTPERDDELSACFIRGVTGMKVTVEAESTYGTLASYCDVKYASFSNTSRGILKDGCYVNRFDVISLSGSIPVNVTVKDKRGFSRTQTVSISCYAYEKPSIVPYSGYTDIICERAMDTGELNVGGTYLAIKAGKRFTNISTYNHCRLRYRFREITSDTFCDWITLIDESESINQIQVLIGNVVTNTKTSYEVELSAVDTVGMERSLRFHVSTSSISFMLYDGTDGAAFGKFAEEPHVVDIASHMTLRVRGRMEVLGEKWVSLSLASGMQESAYAYGRKNETGCFYHVSNGNHVHISFNCAYSYAGISKAVNRTPLPEEYRPERTVCSICPANDRMLALVTVQPDGYIRIEWVQTISATSNTTSATVLWVDGYLDYWV